MEPLEIMYADLTEEAQMKVLEHFGIKGPEEQNLDTVPLFVLEAPEGTET